MSASPENSAPLVPLAGLYALTPDDNLLPRLAALVESALQGGVK